MSDFTFITDCCSPEGQHWGSDRHRMNVSCSNLRYTNNDPIYKIQDSQITNISADKKKKWSGENNKILHTVTLKATHSKKLQKTDDRNM